MPRTKALLLDSDTLTKWIFNADLENPVISRSDGDRYVRYVPFSVVADIYLLGKFYGDELEAELGQAARLDFDQVLAEKLYSWFNFSINVLHAHEEVSKDWMSLACSPPVHENANREHLWMAVFARDLVRRRCDVAIASEDPEVYVELRDRGILSEVQIL